MCPGSSATTSSRTPQRLVPLLSRDPAAYTVALSVIGTLRAGHRFGDEASLFGLLEADGEVRGAISRDATVRRAALVVPDVDELVAALRQRGIEVPRSHGKVDRRALQGSVGGRHRPAGDDLDEMRQFLLGELVPPDPPPAGGPRLAREDDLRLALRWFDAFSEELGCPTACRRRACGS